MGKQGSLDLTAGGGGGTCLLRYYISLHQEWDPALTNLSSKKLKDMILLDSFTPDLSLNQKLLQARTVRAKL